MYTLEVRVNGLEVRDSSWTFCVLKLPQSSQDLGDGIFEYVYQIGREDGRLSYQWELVNVGDEDTWVVTHDFTGIIHSTSTTAREAE